MMHGRKAGHMKGETHICLQCRTCPCGRRGPPTSKTRAWTPFAYVVRSPTVPLYNPMFPAVLPIQTLAPTHVPSP